MRILIVEDEQKMAALLHRGLRRHGYAADVAGDGGAALRLAAVTAYDAILLDVGLPDMDGMEACRRLREAGSAVPVLVLTARDGVFDRVAGLDAGADDYLVKPFAFAELLARLRALHRRGGDVRPVVLEAAGLRLDPATRRVSRGAVQIALTATEFALLECLALSRPEVISRKRLAKHVWTQEWSTMDKSLDVHMANLRRKIDRGQSTPLLRTVRGAGYALGE